MVKIPTFEAKGTIDTEVGTTGGKQIPLSQTIGSALAPVTKAIANHAIKEKNFENKTEALKLENESLLELTDVFDRASKLDNKDQAFELVKTESERIKNIYSNRASNKYVQTMFNNSFYGEVQKGIFKVNNRVSTNIIQSLETQVNFKKKRLLTNGLFGDNKLSKELLVNEITKLYRDSYEGRIDKDHLDRIILDIPREIENFEVDRLITDNPRQTLIDLKNPNKFTNLEVKERESFIEKAERKIAPIIKLQYEDHLAKIAKGKESFFDMNTAALVLPTEKVNAMIAEETLSKDRAANNRVILNASLSTTDEVAKGFIEEGYQMYGEVTGDQNKLNIQKLVQDKKKALNSDPVGFIKTFDEEVELAYKELEAETDPNLIKSKKTEIIEMVKEKQRKFKVKSIRVATNEEITKIKTALTDPETSAEDKINFMMFTQEMYGNENMGKVLNQLTDVKLPDDYKIAFSTNSVELKKDIVSSSTQDLDALEKLVRARIPEGKKFNSIKKKVVKEMEDFENVLEIQIEGSVDKTELIQNMEDTIYKAALYKIKYKQMNIGEATKSASQEFLRDYRIPDSQTYMIPVDVNGVRTNTMLIERKAEAILLNIETDGDYLDEFHGKDGYMHYAKFAGAENLTENQVKDRMKATIKNNSKWLLNADMTGIILYTDYNNATAPVVNANGDKIEFFFVDTENNRGIMSTELKYPVTGNNLELIDYPDPYGAYEYEEIITDENQNIGGKSIELEGAVDVVGSLK